MIFNDIYIILMTFLLCQLDTAAYLHIQTYVQTFVATEIFVWIPQIVTISLCIMAMFSSWKMPKKTTTNFNKWNVF